MCEALALLWFIESASLVNPEYMPIVLEQMRGATPDVLTQLTDAAARYRIPGS